MKKFSKSRYIKIIKSDLKTAAWLLNLHYRSEKLKICSRVFVIRNVHHDYADDSLAGVIVYTMPMPNIRLRNIVTCGMFTGFRNRSDQLKFLNAHIRSISRVVIDPRYRGLGLASWLVKKTVRMMNVPIVEALAVMGHIHPFFERAGFTAHKGEMPQRCIRMKQVFLDSGIRSTMFIDPVKCQNVIDKLHKEPAMKIEKAMQKFLQSYRRRAEMPPGLERTRYILSRLAENPVYYIKFCDKSLLKRISCRKGTKKDQLIA